jgi:hypothetical protein
MDVTHIDCGNDGWAHLAAVIDCHDRELVGYEFARRGRAKEAERALEAACIERFGTLRPDGTTPMLRSDNGLIFQSRRFRAACKDYRLRQEFITPFCEVARSVNALRSLTPSCCSSFCSRCLVGPRSLRMLGCDSVGNAIYSIGSRLRPRRDSRFPTEELTTAMVHSRFCRSVRRCGDGGSGGDCWHEVTSIAPHSVEDACNPSRQGDRSDAFAAPGCHA